MTVNGFRLTRGQTIKRETCFKHNLFPLRIQWNLILKKKKKLHYLAPLFVFLRLFIKITHYSMNNYKAHFL